MKDIYEQLPICNRRALVAGGAAATAIATSAPSLVFGQAGEAIARTKQGQLRGRRIGNVYEFRGVRYAEPQTAENRFRPAIPLKPWQGVRDALKNGHSAMQVLSHAGFMTAWAVPNDLSEDCLFLNVWTPAINDGKKRPVMFWCHGGGFTSGSGDCVAFDGKNLAAYHDVVVVTVTHRLGAFGFLDLADVAGSGNAGMLDIVEALKWVRDNMAEFGGDPGNVTIFGQSGGGGKVSVLMAMPGAAGLFHKAIVESGSTLSVRDRSAAAESAAALMAALGVAPAEAAKLRTIPAEQLLEAATKAKVNFSPVVDGVNLPRDPFDPDAPSVSKSVPMIIGSNETETTIMATDEDFQITDTELRERLVGNYGNDMVAVIDSYRAHHPGITAPKLLFRITSDMGMRTNAIAQAERKAQQGGAPAFMYFMKWGSPIMGGKLGARHSIEMAFVFHNQDNPLVQDYVGKGPVQEVLADQFSTAWTTFARTGNPSDPVTGKWEPYNTTTRPTMVFSSKTALIDDPDSADRKLFMGMFESGAPRPTGLSLGKRGPLQQAPVNSHP